MMKEYSVLLLYPDYLNENGDDTYYAFVFAASPKDAVRKARRDAVESQLDDSEIEEEDFAVLLVIEGHHEALSWREEGQ